MRRELVKHLRREHHSSDRESYRQRSSVLQRMNHRAATKPNAARCIAHRSASGRTAPFRQIRARQGSASQSGTTPARTARPEAPLAPHSAPDRATGHEDPDRPRVVFGHRAHHERTKRIRQDNQRRGRERERNEALDRTDSRTAALTSEADRRATRPTPPRGSRHQTPSTPQAVRPARNRRPEPPR